MKKLVFIIILSITTGVFADSALINAFNSGELSPLLEGRTDVKRYYSGCRTLENMLVMSQGGVTKRPGTYYIASAKNAATACRLIPFEYSAEQAYVIEVGDEYMRFFMDGGQILDANDDPYEIDTPYQAADLFELQFVQSADKMYITHNNYDPCELTRTDHNAWTLTDFAFKNGPFLAENITGTTITPDGTTGDVNLLASSALWNSNHEGALWQLTHTVDANEISAGFGSGSEDACSATLRVYKGGAYDFTTFGSWNGTIILQRSRDEGITWKDVVPFTSRRETNISWSGTEDVNDALYRVKMSDYISKTCYYTLLARSFDVKGIVEITEVTDDCNATATVLKNLGDIGATKYWSEGAWSDDEGYPACVALYEERLCFAGTKNKPDTIWMSKTNDWNNFEREGLDTDAITFTLASDTVDVIRWMVPQTALVIGTTGGEWRLSGSAIDEPLTANNVMAKKQSNYGSAQIQALAMNNQILFVQRQDKKIRKFQYSFDQDTWLGLDLTMLADHITGDGITSMAIQKNPYPILWCVREDGQVAALTLEDSHEVVGWAREVFTESGTGTLDASPNYPTLQVADGTFATTQADPGLTKTTAISNVTELQNMNNDLTGNYYLTGDIDASDTANWNDGEGFVPIGNTGTNTEFAGTFDGCGYTITGLFINLNRTNVGLFGAAYSTAASPAMRIANVTLADCDISGARSVGSLIGAIGAEAGTVIVQDCHITGTSTVNFISNYCMQIGGFVGEISNAAGTTVTIVDCTTNATVDGTTLHTDTNPSDAGGFVGAIDSSATTGSISITNCRASGNVDCEGTTNGGSDTGGFAGSGGVRITITDCSAIGDVAGDDAVGGFVGSFSGVDNYTAYCTRCSARGSVAAAKSSAGGFICYQGAAYFTDCYAWGNVTTGVYGYAGGFCQDAWGVSGTPSPYNFMTNCYSIGTAASDNGTGGLIQWNQYNHTVAASYWDTETSGEADSKGGEGHITSWMKSKSNYEDAGWDFDDVWYIADACTYSIGVQSVAVIPGEDEDETWLAITRIINGSVATYIEQMRPFNWGTDNNDIFFVDSGLTHDNTATNTVTGAAHLEGETVAVVADGNYIGAFTVSDSNIVLDANYSVIHAGLPYTARLQPMKLEVVGEPGALLGEIKRIHELYLRFYKTVGCDAGPTWTDYDPLIFNNDPNNTAIYSGDIDFEFDGDYEREGNICLFEDKPLPLTVLALKAKYGKSDE